MKNYPATNEVELSIAEAKNNFRIKILKRSIIKIATLFSILSILVNASADILLNQKLSWSIYSLLSISFVWLVLYILLTKGTNKWFTGISLSAASVLFVYLLSVLSNDISWFFNIALPVIAFSELCILIIVGTISFFSNKGLNAIALILLGSTIIIFGTEVIITHAAGHTVLHWSLINAFATIPTSFLCLYFHHRVLSLASFRKILRIQPNQ